MAEDANVLLKKMAEDMAGLKEEIEALRNECDRHLPLDDSDDEEDTRAMPLSEATKALLETAFCSTLSNSDR